MRTYRWTAPVAIMLAACLAAPAPSRAADDYPNRPVRIVIGFAAGSAADILSRVVGGKLSEILGQQFITENRAGGGSSVAAESVTRARKDGYTLLMGGTPQTIHTTLLPHLAFNFQKQLTPIALVAAVPNVLVVHPSLGAKNVAELIAIGKTKPLFFANSGAGTVGQLSAELFQMRTGVTMVKVPYPGSAQAVTDLLAGRVSAMFAVASTMLPYVDTGKLTALAVPQKTRTSFAPTVPTMTEAGVPGLEAAIWFGLLAPAGTPPEIVERLSRATNDALKSDDVVKALRNQGLDVLGGTPEEFAQYIQSETDKWAAVLKASGLVK